MIGNVAGGSTITICDNATWNMPGSTTIQTNIDIINYGSITDNGNDYKLFFMGQSSLENKSSGTINVGDFENQDAIFINAGSLEAENMYLHGIVINNGNLISTADCGGNASTTCGFFVGDKSNPMENYGMISLVDGVLKEDVIGGVGTFESSGTFIIENNNGMTDNNFVLKNLSFQNMQNVTQGDFTISGVLNCSNVNFSATACFMGAGDYGSNCSSSSDPITQCAILPVVLKEFTYKKRNESISLLWEISMEINSSHYEVLHSTDGKDYESIAVIKATNQGYYQHVMDRLHFGDHYFKLKSVDLDGQSEIIGQTIHFKNNDSQISISPNPAQRERGITVTINEKSNGMISIYDLNGQRITTLAFTDQEKIDVNLAAIEKSGLYIVEISNQYSTVTEKIYVY